MQSPDKCLQGNHILSTQQINTLYMTPWVIREVMYSDLAQGGVILKAAENTRTTSPVNIPTCVKLFLGIGLNWIAMSIFQCIHEVQFSTLHIIINNNITN